MLATDDEVVHAANAPKFRVLRPIMALAGYPRTSTTFALQAEGPRFESGLVHQVSASGPGVSGPAPCSSRLRRCLRCDSGFDLHARYPLRPTNGQAASYLSV